MPEWVLNLTLVVVTALIAPLIRDWFSQRSERDKTDAEVELLEAEAEGEMAGVITALTAAYDKLLSTVQDQLQVAEAGLCLKGEEIQNLKEALEVLHEQYAHAAAFLTISTARLAQCEGRTLANNKAELLNKDKS